MKLIYQVWRWNCLFDSLFILRVSLLLCRGLERECTMTSHVFWLIHVSVYLLDSLLSNHKLVQAQKEITNRLNHESILMFPHPLSLYFFFVCEFDFDFQFLEGYYFARHLHIKPLFFLHHHQQLFVFVCSSFNPIYLEGYINSLWLLQGLGGMVLFVDRPLESSHLSFSSFLLGLVIVISFLSSHVLMTVPLQALHQRETKESRFASSVNRDRTEQNKQNRTRVSQSRKNASSPCDPFGFFCWIPFFHVVLYIPAFVSPLELFC